MWSGKVTTRLDVRNVGACETGARTGASLAREGVGREAREARERGRSGTEPWGSRREQKGSAKERKGAEESGRGRNVYGHNTWHNIHGTQPSVIVARSTILGGPTTQICLPWHYVAAIYPFLPQQPRRRHFRYGVIDPSLAVQPCVPPAIPQLFQMLLTLGTSLYEASPSSLYPNWAVRWRPEAHRRKVLKATLLGLAYAVVVAFLRSSAFELVRLMWERIE